ncbi:hypothetical protein AVEN_102229-1 [Araneus ventricosus]|uniref:Uncharacterized protein n=1 Tax=Araneus ventricosus TaxID=182803 RepID=A0A4Y2GA94_ARAVE|nr:hypothetical protein AVEN_102229-1 [Araneus ventricosus]
MDLRRALLCDKPYLRHCARWTLLRPSLLIAYYKPQVKIGRIHYAWFDAGRFCTICVAGYGRSACWSLCASRSAPVGGLGVGAKAFWRFLNYASAVAVASLLTVATIIRIILPSPWFLYSSATVFMASYTPYCMVSQRCCAQRRRRHAARLLPVISWALSFITLCCRCLHASPHPA